METPRSCLFAAPGGQCHGLKVDGPSVKVRLRRRGGHAVVGDEAMWAAAIRLLVRYTHVDKTAGMLKSVALPGEGRDRPRSTGDTRPTRHPSRIPGRGAHAPGWIMVLPSLGGFLGPGAPNNPPSDGSSPGMTTISSVLVYCGLRVPETPCCPWTVGALGEQCHGLEYSAALSTCANRARSRMAVAHMVSSPKSRLDRWAVDFSPWHCLGGAAKGHKTGSLPPRLAGRGRSSRCGQWQRLGYAE
jgi:hypothetical protein